MNKVFWQQEIVYSTKLGRCAYRWKCIATDGTYGFTTYPKVPQDASGEAFISTAKEALCGLDEYVNAN